MVAICELFAAVVTLMLGLAEIFAAFLCMLLEFLILCIFSGVSAATEQYQLRQKQRAKGSETVQSETQPTNTATSISLKQAAIFFAIAMLTIGSLIAAVVIQNNIRKQRVATTRARLNVLAEEFAEQIKAEKIPGPTSGKLTELDVWKQPLELFIDKALIGSLVVVRSSGPDRKSGTIDDILSVHAVGNSVKKIAGKVTTNGLKTLRDRVIRLIPGINKEELPEEKQIDSE